MAMKKGTKQILLIGGLGVGGYLAYTWWQGRQAAEAEAAGYWPSGYGAGAGAGGFGMSLWGGGLASPCGPCNEGTPEEEPTFTEDGEQVTATGETPMGTNYRVLDSGETQIFNPYTGGWEEIAYPEFAPSVAEGFGGELSAELIRSIQYQTPRGLSPSELAFRRAETGAQRAAAGLIAYPQFAPSMAAGYGEPSAAQAFKMRAATGAASVARPVSVRGAITSPAIEAAFRAAEVGAQRAAAGLIAYPTFAAPKPAATWYPSEPSAVGARAATAARASAAQAASARAATARAQAAVGAARAAAGKIAYPTFAPSRAGGYGVMEPSAAIAKAVAAQRSIPRVGPTSGLTYPEFAPSRAGQVFPASYYSPLRSAATTAVAMAGGGHL